MTEEPSSQSQFPPSFRVGEWLVEPSLDRLCRNGTSVRLRPQLTSLLVLLARRAGRTVSKDEMLAGVWDGRFIAESAISRCIAELRQALHDDARAPTLLLTVPKRGYRLLAPVVFLEPTPEARDQAEGGAEHVLAPPTAGAAEQRERAAPTHRAGHRRVFRWTMASSAGVGVLIAVAWAGGAWSQAPAALERSTVFVADVQNSTGKASFDRAIPLAMTAELARAPFLRVVSSAALDSVLGSEGAATSQTVRDGAGAGACGRYRSAILLSGSVVRLDSHYAVGLEATACGTGESIFRELTEVENEHGVLKTVEASAARLRHHLADLLHPGWKSAAG